MTSLPFKSLAITTSLAFAAIQNHSGEAVYSESPKSNPLVSNFSDPLNNLLLNHPNISDSRLLLDSVNHIYQSKNYLVTDATPEQFVNDLLILLRDPIVHNYQGKRPTCTATNVVTALAEYKPELLAEILSQAVTTGEVLINKGNEKIKLTVPKDCFTPDDSGRNAVLRISQAILMEEFNGDSRWYSSQTGRHYLGSEVKGRGAEMKAVSATLSKLLDREFSCTTAPKSLPEFETILDQTERGPIFFSFRWRKLPTEEFINRVESDGVNPTTYLNQGYTGHMLYYIGESENHFLFDSTWRATTHEKYASNETIGPQTTPQGTFDFSAHLIAMPKDEFFRRVKEVIYPVN